MRRASNYENTDWEMTPKDIKHLAELLRPPGEEESSSEDDLPQAGLPRRGPKEKAESKKPKHKVRIRGNTEPVDEEPEDPQSIWSLSEVPEVPISDDAANDPRERPKYEIKFKQAVTPENIFLKMSNKNPTTASCEHMIITIQMPGEEKEAIDCNMTTTYLDIRSPRYRLNFPLPHPADPDTSNAVWDVATDSLEITVVLNRDLDFANF